MPYYANVHSKLEREIKRGKGSSNSRPSPAAKECSYWIFSHDQIAFLPSSERSDSRQERERERGREKEGAREREREKGRERERERVFVKRAARNLNAAVRTGMGLKLFQHGR